MPDFISLIQYQTGPGIVSFFHSGMGRIGCREVWHSSIYTHTHEHTDTHGHGQVTLMWTVVIDMEMDMYHVCQNTDKMFGLAS